MNVLIISGKKESGKTSLARFLYGYQLKKKGLISYFEIKDDGKLYVNARDEINGNFIGELNIENRDPGFKNWASEYIWPHIKLYNFAERLKDALHFIFGVDYQFLYENKNTETKISWKDFAIMMPPRVISKVKKDGKYDKKMTGRELCQQFGHVCRLVDENCWVDRCLEQITVEDTELALIGDCRFPNEVMRAKMHNPNWNVRIVRLTRQVDEDAHESEVGLDEWMNDKFDLVIDNKELSITEKNNVALETLKSWNWI